MLTDKIVAWLESGEFGSLADAYAPDALLDITVPQWRFQRQGVEEITKELADWWPDLPGRLVTLREAQTEDGVVLEIERRWHEAGREGEVGARQFHRIRAEAGRIVEHSVFCSGLWTPETIARQAVEAPMYRR